MDGLGRAAGSGVPIEFGGETLILNRITIRDFGLIEQHLLKDRPNPIDAARKEAQQFILDAAGLKDSAQDEFLRKQYIAMAEKIMADGLAAARKSNVMKPQEVAEWIDTLPGLQFTIWLKLDQRYPGKFSMEKVGEIMEKLADGEVDRLKKLRDQAAGVDELGNSTGPTSGTLVAGQTGV